MKIVWVEDESQLLQEYTQYLSKEGFEVHGAERVDEAKRLINLVKPDLLVVDWMLPGGSSGLELCKHNAASWGLPFIMVTAKGDELDKVLALELGADDYITKPFGLRELSARIRAVMRRLDHTQAKHSEANEHILQLGALMIDLHKYVVSLDQRKIELTRTEFMLLAKLAGYPGRVFTRVQLMDEALGHDFVGYERTLDSHIRNLRRKLGAETDESLIETVYGVGYRFAESRT